GGKIAGSGSDSSISASADATLEISNSIIRNGFGHGVWFANARGKLTNTLITDVAGLGVYVQTSEAVSIMGNHIVRAAHGPMRVPANGKYIATGNSSTGSGKADAVQIDGGSID